MRKILKYGFFVITLVLFGIITYYGIELKKADNYTEKIILNDLMNYQWRKPNGTEKKFQIRSVNLSEQQLKILLKVQDPGFYSHKGIDLKTPGAGLTTMTQAIVKKLYFEKFTPGLAKIKQSLIARFVVNHRISKEDQITLFINSMFFGRVNEKPIIGLEAAARAYYGKNTPLLTDDEYISLIAMIVMPGTFHILEHPEWNQERVNRIKKLVAGQYIPTGLMDQFYGDLPDEVVHHGLPRFSYFKQKK